MDNNLPNDPPDDNKPPPTFGTHFDPHTNPIDPNNPYQTQSSQPPPPQTPVSDTPDYPTNRTPNHPTHSDVAQRRLRDEHGHFLPFDNQSTPQTPTNPKPPQHPQIPLTSQAFLL